MQTAHPACTTNALKQYLSEDFKLQRQRQAIIEETPNEALGMQGPYDRKTTDFGSSAAVENYFNTIIELFHDEINDNAEQYFSELIKNQCEMMREV